MRVCLSALECSFCLRFDEEERLAVLFIGDDDGGVDPWMGGGGPNKARGKKVYAVSCFFLFLFLQPTSVPHQPTAHLITDAARNRDLPIPILILKKRGKEKGK